LHFARKTSPRFHKRGYEEARPRRTKNKPRMPHERSIRGCEFLTLVPDYFFFGSPGR
jgi:hypothetical protein